MWTKEKPCPEYVRKKISKTLTGVLKYPDRLFTCEHCGKQKRLKDITKFKRSKNHFCSKICGGLFKRGKPLWNGKRIMPWMIKNKFKEGKEPWNKNKKFPEYSGKNSHLWKGGITELRDKIRSSLEYKMWRRKIFERDNYTCKNCKHRGGEKHADHFPKPFAQILFENKIQTVEQAIECIELWDINNGRTLCVPCHKKTDTYPKNLKQNPRVN